MTKDELEQAIRTVRSAQVLVHTDTWSPGGSEATGWDVCNGCGRPDWKAHKEDCPIEKVLAGLQQLEEVLGKESGGMSTPPDDFSEKSDAEKVEALADLYLLCATELKIVTLKEEQRVRELESEVQELTEALRQLWIASDIDGHLHPLGDCYVVDDIDSYLEFMDAREKAQEYLR